MREPGADDREVKGYCPMGCGQTLTLSHRGIITCTWVECPNPAAAAEVLLDSETGHVVLFGETEFTVRHPLRERLGDALMDCALHHHIAGLDGPPATPGRYRARKTGDRWAWEALDG